MTRIYIHIQVSFRGPQAGTVTPDARRPAVDALVLKTRTPTPRGWFFNGKRVLNSLTAKKES